LIAIVRGLPRFDGRSAFTTWAHRVATNACLDELRRRGRRPVPGLDVEVAEATGSVREDAPGLAASTSDRLDIDEALRALPEEFRAPVVLRDQLGMDYAEIAEVLEIPPGTVRSRIARGRAALAATLRQGDEEDGNQTPVQQRPSTEP
jgi:RNA polymerase sigma-70 factor, ECF subfamily